MGHWTIKLGIQNERLLHWPECSCASTKTKLWKSFVATSQLYAKFDCPVAYQNFSLLATAHDCEIGLFSRLYMYTRFWSPCYLCCCLTQAIILLDFWYRFSSAHENVQDRKASKLSSYVTNKRSRKYCWWKCELIIVPPPQQPKFTDNTFVCSTNMKWSVIRDIL